MTIDKEYISDIVVGILSTFLIAPLAVKSSGARNLAPQMQLGIEPPTGSVFFVNEQR